VRGPEGSEAADGGARSVSSRSVKGAMASVMAAARPWRVAATVALLLLLLGGGLSQDPPAVTVSSAVAANVFEQLLQSSPELPLTTPNGQSRGGKFGASAALSNDGNTALVGAPTENEGAGAAWVFTRSDRQWNAVGAELTMPAEASQAGDCGDETAEEEEGETGQITEGADMCRFGISVALSGDGQTAVVGAQHANQNAGAAWIFARSGSTWMREAELAPPDSEAKDRFGRSVAVSADGSTVLVGAPMWKGRAWIFTRSGASWSQTAELTAPERIEGAGQFGRSVALSADGETALIGAPGYPGRQGAAWIFKRSASGWSQPGTELEGEGESAEARFGFSVALSGDGATALVGARDNDGGKGAAWVFARSGATWSEQGPPVVGGGESEEGFGASVALTDQGTSGLIGATYSEGAHGTAWLFESHGAGWVAREKLTPGPSESSRHRIRFGSSVALSSDAQAQLVGGLASEGRGQAWVFGLNPSVEGLTPDRGPTSGGTSVTITGEHLANATAVRFGESEAAIVARTSSKSITVVSPPGTGTVEVVVQNTAGHSAENPGDLFTYTVSAGEGPRGRNKGGETGAEESGGTGSSAGQSSRQVVLPFGPLAGGACGASLLHKKVSVLRHHRALLRLRGTGRGQCRGKLTLRVKLGLAHSAHRRTGHSRYKLTAIGTAAFTIAAGRKLSIAVKLNALGRRLFRADRGRLSASLLIVTSSPAPSSKHRANVRLIRGKHHKSGASNGPKKA
jgi:IPT/TIG domain/FG-GAP repeat